MVFSSPTSFNWIKNGNVYHTHLRGRLMAVMLIQVLFHYSDSFAKINFYTKFFSGPRIQVYFQVIFNLFTHQGRNQGRFDI